MSPKFLEEKLKKEYGNNKHAIYGTMNKIGAMHGNKETAKGKEMEKKHEAKSRALHKKKSEYSKDPHYSKKAVHKRNVERFGEEGLKKMITKSPEDIYEQ